MKEISSEKYSSRRNRIARKYNSIYFNKGSSESAALAAGSVIEVAEKVAAGELSSAIALVRPPGHHAEHDKAMGFCLFNNVAVAANYLLKERPDLGIKKILIVDWDVHHGNATQKMFYDDPHVLVFSVHRFDFGDFYPYEPDASYCFIGEDAGKGYNINVPWEQGKCGDADYIAAWDHILLPVTEAFGPDIILVSAGFDAALGDPLGGCCITPSGYARLLTKLLGFAQGRIVMALEGGYNLRSTANSIFACAKVLLGDKFTFNSSGMQPFESTWRIIQTVRNELKTCWPVLSDKLQEIESWIRPSPSEVHSPTSACTLLGLSSCACPITEETKSGCKRGRNAYVRGTLEGSPTCFNQCSRTTATDKRQNKRTVKAIYKNEELAEAEATATQVFLAGRKRVRNTSVPGTLESSPTCFNECNPTALVDRRGLRGKRDIRAEAEDEELAVLEATTTEVLLAGHKRGRNASVPETLERSPTCFNQRNPTRAKRAFIAEADYEELAALEATATQVFLAGHKRGRNASVPETLERSLTFFNQRNPTPLTNRQRRGGQRARKAINRQMAPDVRAEAVGVELAAVEVTSSQEFLDADFSSDSSDSDYAPRRRRARVVHDAKA